jgi:predicted amidophosphoribosyltransferase
MIFTKKEDYLPTQRYYLTNYYRYRVDGHVNPNFHASQSGLVLDLKEGQSHAIDFFLKQLLVSFSFASGFTICIVPSSDPAKTDTGIAILARRLATAQKCVDGTACIVRTRKIDKLATGGSRDTAVHFDSLKICKTELVKGREVLLLDDVMTTGNSLEASKKMLYDAGATAVQAMAIALTA